MLLLAPWIVNWGHQLPTLLHSRDVLMAPIDFVPTSDPLEAARQLESEAGGAAAVLLTAVTKEPLTGVTIFTQRGRMLFGNSQAAMIFHGNVEEGRKTLGRHWHDYMPVAWVRERLLLLRKINETNTPVLLRTIWRDHQQFTWIYPLGEPLPGRDRIFISITRRISSTMEAEQLAPIAGSFELVESNVMKLSTLASLTTRELQVLALLGSGMNLHEAAKELGLSEKTIDNHRASMYHKLSIHDRAELHAIAARAGLTVRDADRQRL